VKFSPRWLLLALPFLLVGVWMRVRVPRWGDAIAEAIQDAVGAPPPEKPGPPEPDVPDMSSAAPVIDAGVAVDPRVDGGAVRAAAKVVDAGPKDDGGPLSLYVKSDVVDKALAKYGKNVRGRTARNAEGRPIGVRLTGITPAGVGLLDGDLIVAIDGQTTMDDDTATDVVLGAIAHGKSVIHAKLLRGERPIDLTVEVPLDAADQAPESGPADASKAAGNADSGARR
jgi:hypothetical protein